ncbi:MAG: 2-succinyl-5-enolpyruvyl-6-hydroxy-3-cyclohexene-1-carboxylic-acid synthase, partial [Muribaculaceae bacterium]|nr:2-succinyl-5-enolpyruvyl-6-hydroxy-3-cyclohexene-1-carboxylic-acid synthase [Muribaculaceae bacterium]
MAITETIDNDVCRMLASLAADYGVRHVVVSPGTRSAPLAVVFHRSGHFCMHTVIDERCAAFMALGMALKTDSPVLLICTSGSALMNYGPALTEAYYRRVPLIAITADRPARWIDQLDSQTMRQAGALSAVVRRSADIPVAAACNAQLFSKAVREVNEAFSEALSGRKGPVHINVQLDVPLTRMTNAEAALEPRIIRSIRPEASATDFSDIVASLADKKVMIISGDTTPEEQSAFSRTIPNIPVLSEAQSNIPNGFNIGCFDRFINENKALEPDVIITVGGSLVSARLKNWL